MNCVSSSSVHHQSNNGGGMEAMTIEATNELESPRIVSTSGFRTVVERADDEAVIAAPAPLLTAEEPTPAEIPPEPSGAETVEGRHHGSHHHHHGDNSDEEEESEYEYEDDEDAHFSGFLVPGQAWQPGTADLAATGVATVAAQEEEPARIREDEEEEVVEDDDEVADESSATDAGQQAQQQQSSSSSSSSSSRKPKWKEPSREAVNMSLRAEKETSGGKRRLAQDLYRIMNQDTEEAGFSLQPKCEDAMDKWTIKLFQFDEDSNLAKDMMVLGIDHIELEMTFPDQYPFEPPFVRVVRPRFKRQTGFVMNGALCMELLTKDGWNPVNDIESVIVSIRSLLVVGDGRLQAAVDLQKQKYESQLAAALKKGETKDPTRKRQRSESGDRALREDFPQLEEDRKRSSSTENKAGEYSMAEAKAAYSHLSDYHKKKGWDNSGWWARKG